MVKFDMNIITIKNIVNLKKIKPFFGCYDQLMRGFVIFASPPFLPPSLSLHSSFVSRSSSVILFLFFIFIFLSFFVFSISSPFFQGLSGFRTIGYSGMISGSDAPCLKDIVLIG